mmetsp:Transcript_52348/g.132285  ORF Transcript_52348/g.132285 Transcript_52348/m.132285 type:complete len:318 (+) Transcript_52348:71-1024(+)|eukprot:CAMPEP_0115248830 /NCGR_PEP_ID=MMETSP0270-20121206/42272_1 /TAXON_ID=71861 /ORGANISM="Scrippsiella trochoidea, Strain CCMP3099" /LENGTH=317 /DNA_ID=CAMNT_0002664143 /DNA_START=60 /DNA_END=1013 /DNA_ORIENTATION=+
MAPVRYGKAWLESFGINDVICQAMNIPSGENQTTLHLKNLAIDDVRRMLEAADLSGLFNVIWSGIEDLQSGSKPIPSCALGHCDFEAGHVTRASIECSVCGDEKKSGRKMHFCTSCSKAVCPSCVDEAEPVVGRTTTLSAVAMRRRAQSATCARQSVADGLEDEVVHWIEAVTHDKRGRQSASEWLRDGKVLCRLANIIKPGSVSHVNENCTTPWKERENVSAFIKATREMGLMEKDTFSTLDLQEGRDLKVVNSSLLQFGALTRGIPGFSGPYIGIAGQAKIKDEARARLNTTQYGGFRRDITQQLRDGFTNVHHM